MNKETVPNLHPHSPPRYLSYSQGVAIVEVSLLGQYDALQSLAEALRTTRQYRYRLLDDSSLIPVLAGKTPIPTHMMRALTSLFPDEGTIDFLRDPEQLSTTPLISNQAPTPLLEEKIDE